LCPLCNAARLEHFREPAREILGAMAHPTFLTLTIPNTWNLTAQTFREIRGWWKAFFRSNKSWLQGGIYAMEVSYNRANASWHPPLHIVFDAPWPTSGIARSRFVRLKRLLEFSWLRTTSPEARRTYRRNEFDRWMKESAQHVAGSDYNKRFRRVIDLRAV